MVLWLHSHQQKRRGSDEHHSQHQVLRYQACVLVYLVLPSNYIKVKVYHGKVYHGQKPSFDHADGKSKADGSNNREGPWSPEWPCRWESPFNWAIHIELLNKREINLNILSATVFYSLLHPFSFYLPSNICPSFSHSSFFKNSSFMESFWDNCCIFTPLPSHHRPLFSTILQLSSQFVSMTCLLFCLPERSNSEF